MGLQTPTAPFAPGVSTPGVCTMNDTKVVGPTDPAGDKARKVQLLAQLIANPDPQTRHEVLRGFIDRREMLSDLSAQVRQSVENLENKRGPRHDVRDISAYLTVYANLSRRRTDGAEAIASPRNALAATDAALRSGAPLPLVRSGGEAEVAFRTYLTSLDNDKRWKSADGADREALLDELAEGASGKRPAPSQNPIQRDAEEGCHRVGIALSVSLQSEDEERARAYFQPSQPARQAKTTADLTAAVLRPTKSDEPSSALAQKLESHANDLGLDVELIKRRTEQNVAWLRHRIYEETVPPEMRVDPTNKYDSEKATSAFLKMGYDRMLSPSRPVFANGQTLDEVITVRAFVGAIRAEIGDTAFHSEAGAKLRAELDGSQRVKPKATGRADTCRARIMTIMPPRPTASETAPQRPPHEALTPRTKSDHGDWNGR